MEIAVATELSSGAISSILESVPGIAPFRIQDTRELIKYAVRRGLIGSDEGDRVTGEIEGAAAVKAEKAATRKAAREERKRDSGHETRSHGRPSERGAPARKPPAPKKPARRPAAPGPRPPCASASRT